MKLKAVSVLVVALMACFAVQASASTCVDCHKKVTPGIVEQHESGAMSQADTLSSE